jgi:hypothetical protein
MIVYRKAAGKNTNSFDKEYSWCLQRMEVLISSVPC